MGINLPSLSVNGSLKYLISNTGWKHFPRQIQYSLGLYLIAIYHFYEMYKSQLVYLMMYKQIQFRKIGFR